MLVILITWAGGGACPTWKLKAAEVWLATKVGFALTTKVTLKFCGELPAPVEPTLTVSTYVFGASPASTDGVTDKETPCGVVPLVGRTVRKFGPPLTGVAETVKFKGAPELVI